MESNATTQNEQKSRVLNPANFYGDDLETVGREFPMQVFDRAVDNLKQEFTEWLKDNASDDVQDAFGDLSLGLALKTTYDKRQLTVSDYINIPSVFNKMIIGIENLGGIPMDE
jgi:predicted translin family RNA/ssDNA-binding protein